MSSFVYSIDLKHIRIQADAAAEHDREKIESPMQFEHLKSTIMGGSVSSYDGFRVIVQKQVNLNTVVSHL